MNKLDLLKLLESVPDDGLIVINGDQNGDGFIAATELTPIEIINNNKINKWEGEYLLYTTLSANNAPFVAYRIK